MKRYDDAGGMAAIKEGAVFLADAHYPHHGDALIRLLRAIEEGRVDTPQLFLMGDVFDLLFGYNDYIRIFSEEAIALLNTLSQKVSIYYFEGNHDFCLEELFPNISVFSREKQPVRFRFDNGIAALSHGDLYDAGIGYEIYTKLLRNQMTLRLLRPWEKSIIDDRMRKLRGKKICNPYVGFEQKVQRILRHYRDDKLVIEGHFHQGKRIGNYVSLPSLACQNAVGVKEGGDIRFVSLDDIVPAS